jgi:hypothetical protein
VSIRCPSAMSRLLVSMGDSASFPLPVRPSDLLPSTA